MVLGLMLRKSKKSTPEGPAPIRAPSLPDIRAQAMAWPESLVDLPSYQQPAPDQPPPRVSTTGPIASIYARPPSSFSRGEPTPRRSSASQRRPRMPTPFNLMVAGPCGVGKSALLRLLLQMSGLPAPLDALPARPTRALSTATTELPGPERLVLTVIDTPGLDYSDGAELELEKSVTALVKYIDTQYAETLGEVRPDRRPPLLITEFVLGIQSCPPEQGRPPRPPMCLSHRPSLHPVPHPAQPAQAACEILYPRQLGRRLGLGRVRR